MKAIVTVSYLLWFSIIYHANLQGEAANYTNGFPTRLIDSISFRFGYSTRLIPEMNFDCNGIITGYTAALKDSGNGDLYPLIQVWRKNTSQPGSYYKTNAGIAINETLCVGGLRNISSGVFHCNLNQTISRVVVQPGDILGLELPNRDNDDIRLAFARVGRGPTNYVFNTSEGLSMYSSALLGMNRELPQITLEVGSNSNCIRGFPDIPVSTVGGRTTNANMTTLVIPEMNFTCNASIVGFTVAGRDLDRQPHSRVQIWHKNSSQSSRIYYQVRRFSVHGGVCVARGSIVGDTFWCILHDNFRVPVEPGDIFGLELPATDSDDILFTNGGPRNYIFRHANQLDSNINLSHNRSSTTPQLPQIMLDLTSAHCLSGFAGEPVFDGPEQPNTTRTQLITRLFPNLKFGCFGTIVRVTAAVWDTDYGWQAPRIQIWRENKNQPGLYYKTSSDVQILGLNPPCYQSTISNRIFECTLREDYRISVQPGDFLGLEIPSYHSDDLVVYFRAGGPTNLVFQGRLGSTVDLFTKPHTIVYEEPQINFLVVLDENADTCPDVSTAPPLTTAATTQTITTPDEIISTESSDSDNTSVSPVTATTQASNENNLMTTTTTTVLPPVTTIHASATSDSTTMIDTTGSPDLTTTVLTTIASPEILESSSEMMNITIGVMGGLIAIMVIMAVILSVVVPRLIQQQRKLKSIMTRYNPTNDASGVSLQRVSHTLIKSGDTTNQDDKNLVDVDKSDACPNPAYGVTSRERENDKDGIFLNPAYDVPRRDMPNDDDDEAPDYTYDEVTVLK